MQLYLDLKKKEKSEIRGNYKHSFDYICKALLKKDLQICYL